MKWIAQVTRIMEEHYEVEMEQDTKPTKAEVLATNFDNPSHTFVRFESVKEIREAR